MQKVQTMECQSGTFCTQLSPQQPAQEGDKSKHIDVAERIQAGEGRCWDQENTEISGAVVHFSLACEILLRSWYPRGVLSQHSFDMGQKDLRQWIKHTAKSF